MFTGTPNSIRINVVSDHQPFSRLFRRALPSALLVLSLCVARGFADPIAAPVVVPIETPAQWIHAGELRDLTIHKIDKEDYLKVERLAQLSDAQVRWQPAAGQVCLNNPNGELCFDWDSKAVSLDDHRLRDTVPMRFESNDLFVPLRFVTTPAFESFSATHLSWNPEHRQLVQDPEVNLRIPQVERANGIYRLAFDVNPSSEPQLIEKSDKRIWLRFSRAVSNGSQVLEGDTVIHEVRVNQKRHSVDLMLTLGDDAADSDVYFEDGRRRLVIEVTPTAKAVALAPAPADANDEPKLAGAPVEPAPAPHPVPAAPAKPKKTRHLSIPDHASPLPLIAAAPKPAPLTAPGASKTKILKVAAAPAHMSGVRTYVIDAGHGGVDCGAIGVRGTMEKDINLAVARELARQLKKEKNVRVIMTRDDDQFVPLSQRTAIANAANADLFVSIHCNSALSSKGNGFESYYLAADATDKAAAAVARVENSVVSLEVQKGAEHSKLGQLLASMAVYNFMNESSRFADFICKKVHDRANVDRTSVKEANFFVLRGAQMPSVLLELEYLSNPVSEIRLRSSRYQSQLVKGILDGLLAYDRQYHQEQTAYARQPGRDSGRTER